MNSSGQGRRRGRLGDVRGQSLGDDLWPASRTLLCSVSGDVCICVRACVLYVCVRERETETGVRVIVMYLCINEHSSAVTLVIMSIHEVAAVPLCSRFDIMC